MINNTKRFLLLQVILFTLFPISSLGQSEYAIKQRIQESLEEFMNMLSYVNDEEEVITPSMIATRYSGGNYFRFNGKEMKLQNFIEDYCYSDLQRQIVNHLLSISPNSITKASNNPSDQRWSVNGVLKREYATNKQDNISDVEVKLIILWRGVNEEIGLLELNFHSEIRMSISNVRGQSIASQVDNSPKSVQADYSTYLNKALEKLEAGDYESAQKLYNVYKELSGKSVQSIEVLINDRKKEEEFCIGGTIILDGEKYIIAHLVGSTKHGFAVKEIGNFDLDSQNTHKYFSDKQIPSLKEMRIIYKNNDKIGLSGRYWTCSAGAGCIVYTSPSKSAGSKREMTVYTVDFLSGEENDELMWHKNGILLIQRF